MTITNLPARLSLTSARKVHLAAQGMLRPPAKARNREAALAAIKNMGVLQIDTISVVARSPYLVLFCRLGAYPQEWLDQLLADGQLFEYWAHEACFIPIEDFAYYRHRMLDPSGMGWKYAETWHNQHREQVENVLQHIRDNGATRSADFARQDGKGGGWWEWKPEKRALEVLFTSGKLMIARRDKFHRIYDLTERVHPSWDDAHLPPFADLMQAKFLQAVHALGICKASWIADYFRTKNRDLPDMAALVAQGVLQQIEVEGFAQPFYFHPARQELVQQAEQLQATYTCLLSPFDPIVWDRKRALELFDFDYRIECYTPQAKRQYGYFCLPILRRGALIGRVDAKAHRKAGIFTLNAVHLEPSVRISQALAQDLSQAILRCAHWHACPQVQLQTCDPALATLLSPLLANS